MDVEIMHEFELRKQVQLSSPAAVLYRPPLSACMYVCIWSFPSVHCYHSLDLLLFLRMQGSVCMYASSMAARSRAIFIFISISSSPIGKQHNNRPDRCGVGRCLQETCAILISRFID